MTMFSDIIDEWSEYHLDTSLAEAIHLMEKGLHPEVGVQDYDKFHTGVTKAREKLIANHARLHDVKTKFKSRKDKRNQLEKHVARIDKIHHASDIARSFSHRVGNTDNAAGHEDGMSQLKSLSKDSHVASKKDYAYRNREK